MGVWISKCSQPVAESEVKSVMKQNLCLAACLGCVLSVTSLQAQTPVAPTAPVTPSASDAAARKTKVHEHMLRKYDVNHDGQLDANERAAMKADRAARLKQYDTNGDGKLDSGERAKMRADRKALKRAAKAGAVAPPAPAR